MRALNTEFELFGASRVPVGVRTAGVCGRVGDCLAGEDRQAREKCKNSGNEAKKYLKTKDITFLSVAICASFARNSTHLMR